MCQDVTLGLVFLRLFTLRIADFYLAASELLFAPEALAESQSLRLLMGNTLALNLNHTPSHYLLVVFKDCTYSFKIPLHQIDLIGTRKITVLDLVLRHVLSFDEACSKT